METQARVLLLARDKGLFRLSDVAAIGVHPEYVRRLTQRGQLVRLGRGLYAAASLSRPSTTLWRRSPNGFLTGSPAS